MERLWTRLIWSARFAQRLFFIPVFRAKPTHISKTRKEVSIFDYFDMNAIFFAGLPEHYPFHKKLALLKSQSQFGKMWDVLMISMSVVACAFYVAETYISTYDAVKVYGFFELVITQFFLIDFVYGFLSSPNYLKYLTNAWTIVDMLTIAPVYITLAVGPKIHSLSILRFIRILRLVRILRTFRLLGGLSGVRRQIISLSLTLLSMVFMAAGIIQLMENDVKQILYYQCTHIGHLTNFEPSCSPYFLSPNMTANDDSGCDCLRLHCTAFYTRGDPRGQPSGVRCMTLTFLDAFYYMVITGKLGN